MVRLGVLGLALSPTAQSLGPQLLAFWARVRPFSGLRTPGFRV